MFAASECVFHAQPLGWPFIDFHATYTTCGFCFVAESSTKVCIALSRKNGKARGCEGRKVRSIRRMTNTNKRNAFSIGHAQRRITAFLLEPTFGTVILDVLSWVAGILWQHKNSSSRCRYCPPNRHLNAFVKCMPHIIAIVGLMKYRCWIPYSTNGTRDARGVLICGNIIVLSRELQCTHKGAHAIFECQFKTYYFINR